MRFTFASSAFETSVPRSSLRLSFELLEVRMCRMKACARLTLPVPVFLKRFAAPECVFRLYMAFLVGDPHVHSERYAWIPKCNRAGRLRSSVLYRAAQVSDNRSMHPLSPALQVEHERIVIPSTMRAAVYRGINDVRVEELPLPAIGRGELLVKIAGYGICGTDLKKIHTGSHSAPRIFGHEMSGTVVRVGDGVSKFEAGDRVMVFHHIPCGDCYYCRKKTYAQCPVYKKVGATAGFEPSGGGFAEYIRVMDWIVDSGVVRVPDHVSFEQAAFIEPVNTCLKAVKLLNLEADETVLIIGQGPIGIILAAMASDSGATIVGSDLYPERLTVSREFGVQHTIHAAEEDVAERVCELIGGRRADVVLVAVPGKALIKQAMDLCRPGGKVMLFAATQHEDANFDPGAVCLDEKSLLGSYSASVDIQSETAELVFSGKWDFTKLISHRFSIERAIEGIELAAHSQPDSMKIFIEAQA